jgi:peptide deformylase
MRILEDGEDDVLRTPSKKVPKELFGTKELSLMLKSMFDLLKREHDGVAIAAPQVGIPYQIFVVSPSLKLAKKEKHLIYINPKISKKSLDTKYMDEGCLSVRWLYGQVKRHTKVTITAYDENGLRFERAVSGLLAHIFQHETDHLHGVLFIDKAIGLVRLSEEDIETLESKNERT